MTDRKLKSTEPPGAAAVQTNPGDDFTITVSQPKTDDAKEKEKKVETLLPKPESRGLKPFDTTTAGVGYKGSSRGSYPMIQVTRASTGSLDYAGPGQLGPPSPRLGVPTVDDIPSISGEPSPVASADGTVHSRGLEVPSPVVGGAMTSASFQLQMLQQSRPLCPGIGVVVLGSVLFSVGAILAALGFMLFGFAMIILGALFLVCATTYLVVCGLESFITKRQKQFREFAREQGPGWLTRPSSNRRRMKRTSSTEIGLSRNSSEEKVQIVEDLNLENNELLIPPNAKSVTKATVAAPKSTKLSEF